MTGWQLALALLPPVVVIFGIGFAFGHRAGAREALVFAAAHVDAAYMRGIRDCAATTRSALKNNATRSAGAMVSVVEAVHRHAVEQLAKSDPGPR